MQFPLVQRLREWLSASVSFLTPVRLLAIIAISAFFWFLIMGDQGVYQLVKLLHLKESLRTEKESLTSDINHLTDERTLLAEPQNLEMVIRSELGVIKPGEIIFQERSRTPDAKHEGEPQQNAHDALSSK